MRLHDLPRGLACATLLRRLVDLYRRDALFQLAEWHDSFAIDHVRRQCEAAGELRCVILSGDAENTKHPLVNGPLGARLDHLKGPRKQLGRSHRRDLARPAPKPTGSRPEACTPAAHRLPLRPRRTCVATQV